MYKKLLIVAMLVLLGIVSSCENSSGDYKDCVSQQDCPLGFVCDIAVGKCKMEGDDSISNLPDGSDLPDSGNLPDDGTLPDSDDYNPKGDVTCDCFGAKYTIPAKFENIQGWCKADEDSDGIPNCIEVANGVPVDTDEDQTSDYKDTDSDGDGIPDKVECSSLPCKDTDSDGIPDYRDTDSDEDGIADNVECFSDPCVDSDSDGTPDYLDIDSDNDGVPDVRETAKDTDKDGTPNFLDDDSDGDGILDGEECPSIPCADSDGDGVPDFVDQDSDGDGLPDSQEVYCTVLGIHSRTQADTDGDGYSDMAEILIGSDPCNAAEGVKDKGVKFYFELPFEGEQKEDILTFAPTVKKADIAFNVDTTGSMNGEISNLRSSLSGTIIPQTRARITDSAFAASQWGDVNEVSPLIVSHPTTDTGTAQAAVNALKSCNGGDYPEAGYWSLLNVVNGLNWRSGTIPIFIHITDATSHTSGATRDQAVNALNAKGAKVITVFSGNDSNAVNQLNDLSNSTGAVVPACAGAGRTTLRYDINSDGTGLGTSTVSGIDALVKYATFSVYVVPSDDGNTTTIDTACFLKKVEALEFTPPPGDACASTLVATPAAFNGSAYNNGYNNFYTGTSNATTPGSQLKFKVVAQNDTCFESTSVAQLFKAFIKVVDNATGSILDTQEVTVIVPGVVTGDDW